jgi:hypothetical protein
MLAAAVIVFLVFEAWPPVDLIARAVEAEPRVA